jgi:DNA-binding response OmpR family regulator
MKILVADDDRTFRMVLAGTLQAQGHEVVTAADGLEAWEAIRKEYIPVVILDWKMPQIDGLRLCTITRALQPRKYSYLILITAHGAAEHYQQGIQAGADDFLAKPFDEDYLVARLMVAERIITLQNHTRQLEAIMAICSYCKKVRSEADQWLSMEEFALTQPGVVPTHTICPTCFAIKVKPELERLGIKVEPEKVF